MERGVRLFGVCVHFLFVKAVLMSSAEASISIEPITDNAQRFGDDFVVPSHDKWALRCHSSTSSPDQWILPALPQAFKDFSHPGELLSRISKTKKSTGLEMEVFDANYRDTGPYTCRLKDNTIKSVYVYVFDQYKLIVTPSADVAVPISIKKSQPSLVPCRPTHPQAVNLSLSHCVPSTNLRIYVEKCGTGRRLEEFPKDSFKFDPHRGFRVDWSAVPFSNGKKEEIFCIANGHNRMSELKFNIEFHEEEVTFRPPQIEGRNSKYLSKGETIKLNCSTENYTTSTIQVDWILPNIDTQNERIKLGATKTTKRSCNKSQCQSHVRILEITSAQLNDSGVYKCIARDNGRSEEATFNVTVHEGRIIYANISANQTEYGAFLSQNVLFMAHVEALIEPELEWYYYYYWPTNKTRLRADKSKFVIRENSTNAWLQISNIENNDFGVYELKSKVKNQTQSLNFTLHFQGKPSVNMKIVPTKEDSFSFSCNFTAYPPVEAISLSFSECFMSHDCPKDTMVLSHNIPNEFLYAGNFVSLPADWPNQVQYLLTERNKNLIFTVRGLRQTPGEYTCVAHNSLGSSPIEESFPVTLHEEGPLKPSIVAVIAIIVLILVALSIVLIIKIRKERKRKELFRIHQLDGFRKGDPGSINPDLPVDEQSELLPYDRKWEFPRERLKLGVQLGAGAFGRVLKGEAIRIGAEPVSTVAVKMVRAQGNMTALKALMSELKIMIHLGSHLNVVNLLGACTKRVTRGELYVIVEYCRFGNLQNYLIRHRDRFINQLDGNGEVNANSSSEKLSTSTNATSAYSVLRNQFESDYRTAGTVSFTETTNGTLVQTNNLRSDMSETDSSGVFVTSSSGQSNTVWRTNYRGDYRDQPTQLVSTKDLICWAFQIARGMSYLVKRKVLHGDLAARNVLLADDNIVKVADFGLAREVYRSENYKKKGEGPLPVKWMAIESIADRVFSTQSDVWSFGVVMWELFSLGKTPYPGLEADENFYRKLLDGYRMEKPRYAPNAMYSLMTDCWKSKPLERPSFVRLEESLGAHLEETVRQHYVDLNESYIRANCPVVGNEAVDYLEMMADVETKDHPQQSVYVNMKDSEAASDNICRENEIEQPDYLQMDSNADDADGLELSGYLQMGKSFSDPEMTLSKCTDGSASPGCPEPSHGDVPVEELSTVQDDEDLKINITGICY